MHSVLVFLFDCKSLLLALLNNEFWIKKLNDSGKDILMNSVCPSHLSIDSGCHVIDIDINNVDYGVFGIQKEAFIVHWQGHSK